MINHHLWLIGTLLLLSAPVYSMNTTTEAPSVSIPISLGLRGEHSHIIFSDNGKYVIVNDSNDLSQAKHYTHENNLLEIADHQPLSANEKAQLINACNPFCSAFNASKKQCATTSYTHHIQAGSKIVTQASGNNSKVVATHSINPPFTDDTLIASTELDGRPLLAYYQPKEQVLVVVCTLSNNCNETCLPLNPSQRVQQLLFTRMDNSTSCMLALLLSSSRGADLLPIQVHRNAQGNILCQARISSKHMQPMGIDGKHMTLYSEYTPSLGSSPNGKYVVWTHRTTKGSMFVVDLLKNRQTTLPVTTYDILTTSISEQGKLTLTSSRKSIDIYKDLNHIAKTPVMVSADGTKAIVDGMLVDLSN